MLGKTQFYVEQPGTPGEVTAGVDHLGLNRWIVVVTLLRCNHMSFRDCRKMNRRSGGLEKGQAYLSFFGKAF